MRAHPSSANVSVSAAILALTTLAACSDEPVEPGSSAIPERFRALSQQIDAERQALEIPGMAVAILEHGQLAFAQGFGTKGIASQDAVDAETIFHTGSMGKVVTAIGALSAVDDGLLDLDAPVRQAIADLSLQGPEADALTLRQVLSQQSGLSDYLELEGNPDDSALADFVASDTFAENVDFINPPGAFWNYSNPNYVLAGRALEASVGVSYRQAIEERVFAALGMNRSFLLPEEVLADGDFSNGYGINDVFGDGPMEDLAPDAYDNAWARPAGFAYSNVLDWAKLMQFLMAGSENVLSESARTELVSPQVSTHTIYADVKATALGLGDDYGFGIGVSDGFFMDHRGEPDLYYPAAVLGHGGDIPGFASTFAIVPSTGFGIVVLSNRDALRPVESIRMALETFGELPAPSAPPAGREIDESRFASYAGSFVARDGGRIEISLDAGQLRLSTSLLEGLATYEPVLEPTSLDNFALWVTISGERVPLEVTFLPGENGAFDWFRSRIAVGQREAPAVTP